MTFHYFAPGHWMLDMVISNTTIHDLSPDKLPHTKRLFESLSTPQLPDEILSSIFLIATHHFQDRFESILTPIAISHVSPHWREVAISTRGLWTTIILTFPTFLSQLSCAMTWLSRSYPYPLNIFLDFRDPSWEWEEDSQSLHLQNLIYVLQLLLPHVKRWCHFELLTDTWAPIFYFLCYTRHVEAAPLLRSLSLSRCNAFFAAKEAVFQPAQLQDPIPLFGGLALDALRDVSLVGVHVDWARSSLHNLTTLEFKYHARGVMPSLDQFLDILSGCLELRHLSIMGWGPQFKKITTEGLGNTQENWDPTIEARRIIQLRHLVKFSFGFIDVNYAIKVLSLFLFPSIENLTLEDVSFTLNPVDYQNATPILDWLTPRNESSNASTSIPRTVCGIPLDGILSLQLHSIYATDAVFSRFFSAFPSLQKLGLFNAVEFSLWVLHPSTDPCIPHPCPILEELECRNVDPTGLVDVVRSRATIDSILPLESVIFDPPLTHADCLELNDVGIEIF